MNRQNRMMTMTELQLPDSTANGRARADALDPRHRPDVTPTSVVSYLSHGRVLVIGDEAAALDAARRLDDSLTATLVVPGADVPATVNVDGLTCLRGGKPALSGSLGNFRLGFDGTDAEQPPAAVALFAQARFDLVLDLGDAPMLQAEVPPPGYYAPRGDASLLQDAIDELPDMCGEFEKPKFFVYDPEICAHGSRGLEGCTRCLNVCPAWAITSIGERIAVDPNLCQGYGSCASVCPTGAIGYAFPSTRDLLDYLRKTLGRYRDAGGADPVLLLYDGASAGSVEQSLARALPENVLPLRLEEVGSLGMDAWFTSLAYGFRRVLVLRTPDTPQSIVDMIEREIAVAGAILDGMGFPVDAIRLLAADDEDEVVGAARDGSSVEIDRPAKFAPPPEKPLLVQAAVGHLFEQAPAQRKSVTLPAGAPFGQVRVNGDACTLCMSCVAVCPTSALREGQGLPQLGFVEASCVQCELCERACPEDAITLETRFVYDQNERRTRRLLHEEQPFCCISCGKPFATRSMLRVMEQKLAGHWMFQKEEERRRLEMCDDCRVKDLMRAQLGKGPKSI